MIVVSIIIITMPTIILGKESVSIFGLVFLPVGMILVFTHQERMSYFRYLALYAVLFSIALYWVHHYDPFLELDKEAIDELNLSDLITVLVASMMVSFIYFQKNTAIQNNLRIERKKSDNILLKIFPALIVERLKEEESEVVDYFDEVTVVFIDIVGFTKYADRMAPQDLVKMLDDFFSAFDTIAKKYQIEKIKTIGDAYMAVAGLPKPNPQHYLDAANFVLEIKELVREGYLKKYNLEVRIGMHSGPVVAGVIGESKFSYDLWGSAVNIASRFESQGEPGKIHISEEVKDLLGNDFEIEFNGKLDIKGLGLKNSFFLVQKKLGLD